MPLYEYECAKCGHRTEVIQRVGAGPPGDCSECGGQLRRLLSAPAFQFKGSGWYVTDYARKGASSGERSQEGGEAKSKKESSDKKSDSTSKSKTAKAS
ncbi:MAG: FmdB family zinc ribbon protein [Thermoanaerobaculia bacterium]